MKKYTENIDPRDIDALKMDLNFAWETRHDKVDIIDGELVEVEMTSFEKHQATKTFISSIDPESMDTLRKVWSNCPGHFSKWDVAMHIMN